MSVGNDRPYCMRYLNGCSSEDAVFVVYAYDQEWMVASETAQDIYELSPVSSDVVAGLTVLLQIDIFAAVLFLPAVLTLPLLLLVPVQSYFNVLIILLLPNLPFASLLSALTADFLMAHLMGSYTSSHERPQSFAPYAQAVKDYAMGWNQH
jgi:hypothetical protein